MHKDFYILTFIDLYVLLCFVLRIVSKGKRKQPCRNSWFSHDVTKIQTKKLSILPRFYFHDALE